MAKTGLILFSIIFLLGCALLPKAFAETVPKSETIVIAGQLNDVKERAKSFDNEEEYAYGNVDFAWRKTSFDSNGTLVITISFDEGTDYSVEMQNYCSNQNFCNLYEFGRFKTCTMNVFPGEYYFKVFKNYGDGNFILDVDIIKGKRVSSTNVPNCGSGACSNDSDCGGKSFAKNECLNGDAYSVKTAPYCENPGQTNSKCLTRETARLIEECDYNCQEGTCVRMTLEEPEQPVKTIEEKKAPNSIEKFIQAIRKMLSAIGINWFQSAN